VILPLTLLQFLELAYIKLNFSQVVHLACHLLLPVSRMAYFSILKMEAICSSETSNYNYMALNPKEREIEIYPIILVQRFMPTFLFAFTVVFFITVFNFFKLKLLPVNI
jgi:hypothetical protein